MSPTTSTISDEKGFLAGGQGTEIGDEQRTLLENVVKYRKVALVTLALTSAILLHGYDSVVVGATSGMPMFVYVFIVAIEE